ncbi:MAG: hypothetical protein L0Y71_08485 [Gemmataceae bacterium]|nr:hypothetical protein [Gemmataceae bacterium]
MAAAHSYHPAELAYLFSYLRVKGIIGWGPEPFTPPPGREDAFYGDGRDRLLRNQRILQGKQPGRHRFADATAQLGATLSDPQIVFVTHRREQDAAHVLTHHVAGEHVVEMSRGTDGMFQVVEYPTLAGAAGAAAAFVGATDQPVQTPVRIEANAKVFARMKELAREGKAQLAVAALTQLGADEAAARSVASAFGRPAASGVVSVMYCSGNVAQDVEPYAVLTSSADESWLTFPPATADGPVVLEQTSVGALTARILVGVSAKLVMPL